MRTPLITDIQKYSIHDGPGIRTTVFFKGCPLHCQWCHNPETQSYEQQVYYNRERCVTCGQCALHCENQAIRIETNNVFTDMNVCKECKVCMEYCIQGARELVGRYMEPGDLIKELKKDLMFYEESGGGITLSGGEVMTVDSEYLLRVMEPLHRQGYSLGIDTCGFAPYEQFEKVLPYTDFFLYDIKLIDNNEHKRYTGVSNDLILNNLKLLSDAGARIYLRIPVIEQVNANASEMKCIIDFMKEHRIRIIKVYLLPYHPMGKSKHERLQMIYQNDFEVPDQKKMEELQSLFEQNGYATVIGG